METGEKRKKVVLESATPPNRQEITVMGGERPSTPFKEGKGDARKILSPKRLSHHAIHWSKELIIAAVLALLTAIGVEVYKDRAAASRIRENQQAVATIQTFGKHGDLVGQGSGVFIKPGGLLVTNLHVLQGAHDWVARLPSGAYYKGMDVKGFSREFDLVVLQVEAKENPYVKVVGDSDDLAAGDPVVAIGSPLGLENSVSTGVVSNPKRMLGEREYIQFTAPISPGSSGGALLSKAGALIGITAASEEGSEGNGQNLNLAVPSKKLKPLLAGSSEGLPNDNAELCYLRGKLAENKKDYDQAVLYYSKAISLNPRLKDGFLDLGGIYFVKGEFKAELENYRAAAAIDPKDFDVLYYLGTAYEDNGLYREAVEAYRRALTIDPKNKDSLYQLVLLNIVLGQRDEATTLLPRLIEVNPGMGNELQLLLRR